MRYSVDNDWMVMIQSILKKLAFLLSILAGVSAASGEDFWVKKSYKEWSERECAKILQDSPWSKKFTLNAVSILDSATSNSTSDGQQPYINYLVQFRSALPVRQAMVRQMQIAKKYDSFSPEQKQEFDKSVEGFLSADPGDSIVVDITYEANSQPNTLELQHHWQSRTTSVLKNEVLLIPDKGSKVYLNRYVVLEAGQREFQFIFPRQIDGKPILTPQDKSIKLEFVCPIIANMGSGKAFLEFKTNKMMFENNLAY